jgi:hypothetical protein
MTVFVAEVFRIRIERWARTEVVAVDFCGSQVRFSEYLTQNGATADSGSGIVGLLDSKGHLDICERYSLSRQTQRVAAALLSID